MQSYIYGCTYIIFISESLLNVQSIFVVYIHIFRIHTNYYPCKTNLYVYAMITAQTYKYNNVFILFYINLLNKQAFLHKNVITLLHIFRKRKRKICCCKAIVGLQGWILQYLCEMLNLICQALGYTVSVNFCDSPNMSVSEQSLDEII